MPRGALHARACIATERAVSVAGVVPVPFMRRHSLFGDTIRPLIQVVSELPRSSTLARSAPSLLLLTWRWMPVRCCASRPRAQVIVWTTSS